MTQPVRILYVGALYHGGNCLQRLQALRKIGHIVTGLDDHSNVGYLKKQASRLSNRFFQMGLSFAGPFDLCGINKQVAQALRTSTYDVLWLDKVLTLRSDIFRGFKARFPNGKIIGYAPDDMCGRHNQSARFLRSLKYYDCFITTKSHNLLPLQELGCENVVFIDNSFDPETHRPIHLTDQEKSSIGGKVGFIGSYEEERAQTIRYLANNGIPVKVYCEFWPPNPVDEANIEICRKSLYGDDYAKGICAFDIALCFLRKLNRDRQTVRSIEIPACGTLMLAERTKEHMRLFEEGKEADFFDSDEELLQKVRFYLENPAQRIAIAAAGRERCLRDDYSCEGRLSKILDSVLT